MLLGFSTGILGRPSQALLPLPSTHLHTPQYVANCHCIKPWLPQRYIEVYLIAINPPHAVLGEVSISFKRRNDAMDEPFGQSQPVRHFSDSEVVVLRNQGKHRSVAAFLVYLSVAMPLLAAGGMALGHTLEAVLGAVLLTRVIRLSPSLERLQDVGG